MALKATIFKAQLQIADIERHYYQDHTLTIARHPSETDERMMVRVLVFALHAHDRLQLTKGISADDEPDLWQKSLTDDIELWIDLGQPDEKRIRKACGRARRVFIYTYAQRGARVWWQQIAEQLQRFDNLSVFNIPDAAVAELARLAQRTMQLQCTIQEGQIWLGDASNSVSIALDAWKQTTLPGNP